MRACATESLKPDYVPSMRDITLISNRLEVNAGLLFSLRSHALSNGGYTSTVMCNILCMRPLVNCLRYWHRLHRGQAPEETQRNLKEGGPDHPAGPEGSMKQIHSECEGTCRKRSCATSCLMLCSLCHQACRRPRRWLVKGQQHADSATYLARNRLAD